MSGTTESKLCLNSNKFRSLRNHLILSCNPPLKYIRFLKLRCIILHVRSRSICLSNLAAYDGLLRADADDSQGRVRWDI